MPRLATNPGVVLDPAGGEVAVAVLHAPDLAHHLATIDEFEGSGYRRTTTTVHTADGQAPAWIYVLTGPPHGP